jgi:hypothetical protein
MDLARTDRGVVLGTVSNLIAIVGQDPVLAGLCGFNEFSNEPILHGPPPVLFTPLRRCQARIRGHGLKSM